MQLQMRKRDASIIERGIGLWLVCWTGFDFVESLRRHGSHTVREGIFFALAVILMLATVIKFKAQNQDSES